MPAIGPLDDPSTRSPTATAGQGGLSSTADMGADASLADSLLGISVVVALVQAEVLGAPGTPWSAHDNGIERLSHHPLVVHVGASDEHRLVNDNYPNDMPSPISLGSPRSLRSLR